MRRRHLVNGLFLILVFFCPLIGRSQTSSSESLGDLARRQREERTRAASKVTKVFTNDNLPARPKEEARSMATAISAPAVAPAGKKTEIAPSGGEAEASARHDEKYYRSQMAEIQHRLDTHKRELEVLQQKSGLNQTQFYTDPNKTLQQEFTRTDINKLNDDIAKKKEQIAKDEKDMDDLRDQLRREGGNPGWIR